MTYHILRIDWAKPKEMETELNDYLAKLEDKASVPVEATVEQMSVDGPEVLFLIAVKAL